MSDLGYSEGDDYEIHVEVGENESISSFREKMYDITWGVEQHVTVYEFLQDLMRMVDGTIHIDRGNKIHFYEEGPGHQLWAQNASDPDAVDLLPPIIEWQNADEEDQTNTVAKASYDETGLGIYSVVNEE